jgi:DNA polymerase I
MDLSNLISVKKAQQGKKPQCKKCAYFDRPFLPFYFGETDIVIVGKMPSEKDIADKMVFSGQNGSFLRQTLREVGFDDTRVSFFNVVCCNPKDHNSISKSVIKECSHRFLIPEIQKMSPKLVLLAGNTALQIFFPKKKVMSERGKFLVDGLTFMPIFHPVYCARQPELKDIFKKDLHRARLIIEGRAYENTNYRILTTVEMLDEYEGKLKDKKIVSVDIETNHTTDPFKEGVALWTIAFGCGDFNVCIPLDHPECPESVVFQDRAKEFVATLLESSRAKVFHNSSFDTKMLRRFGYKVNGFIHDTMIMAFLLDGNKKSYKLKDLAEEYFEGYLHTFNDSLEALAMYNNEDVDNTYKLYELFAPQLKKQPQLCRLYKEVVAPMALVIADMEYNGIKIDLGYCNRLKEVLAEQIADTLSHIDKTYPDTRNVDLNSPQQLSKLLFDVLKYPVVKKTDKGARSVDAEVLEKLVKKRCSLAKHILSLRTLNKLLSTYVTGLPTKVDSTSRLHGSFHIIGTKTGRLASSGPNLQNIPKNRAIKKLFVPREGYVLLNADASQAELRVAGSISDETNMINAYNTGQDIHILTASNILKKSLSKVTKDDRQKAKGVNFGFLYGSTAEGFQGYAEKEYGLRLTLSESVQFREAYFNLFPKLLVWYANIKKSLFDRGLVSYPTGRTVRFPEVRGVFDLPSDILRKAINYPVQGSNSDVVCHTMVLLRDVIIKKSLPVYINITVHDSIVMECREDIVEDVINEIDVIARDLIPKFHTWLKVPWVYEYAYGRSWGELIEKK